MQYRHWLFSTNIDYWLQYRHWLFCTNIDYWLQYSNWLFRTNVDYCCTNIDFSVRISIIDCTTDIDYSVLISIIAVQMSAGVPQLTGRRSSPATATTPSLSSSGYLQEGLIDIILFARIIADYEWFLKGQSYYFNQRSKSVQLPEF